MQGENSNQKWATIQNNIEAYEHGAHKVKLTAVVLAVILAIIELPVALSCVILAALWLQEGIYRTSQSRLCEYILRLEGSLEKEPTGAAREPHLYSDWEKTRAGTAGLIAEYLKNSLRPTVAFPYLILIGLVFITDRLSA